MGQGSSTAHGHSHNGAPCHGHGHEAAQAHTPAPSQQLLAAKEVEALHRQHAAIAEIIPRGSSAGVTPPRVDFAATVPHPTPVSGHTQDPVMPTGSFLGAPPPTPAQQPSAEGLVSPSMLPAMPPHEPNVSPPRTAVMLSGPLSGPSTAPAAAQHHAPPAAAPATMRAWVVRKPGPVEDEHCLVQEAAWPVSAPGAGEIRVKVVCAGLNPVDSKRATGFNGAADVAFPAVLGCDGAGVVESIGEGTETDLQLGDRVYFHNNVMKAHGTFAEYTICDAVTVARIADNVSFADAAAAPCAAYTAFNGLFDKLRLQPGSTVLVLGAAGGVGSYAVSLAKLCGCKVAATCSAMSADYVRSLGADVILNYRDMTAAQQLTTLRAAVHHVDCVFDAVGATADADTLTMCCEVLPFGGSLCTALFSPTLATERRLFQRQLSVHFLFTGGLHADKATRPVLRALGDNVMQLMSVGAGGRRLPSHLTELIQFSQLRQGLLTLRDRGGHGKIVMSFAPPAAARKTVLSPSI
jgi:NADPH2:quinone reductase